MSIFSSQRNGICIWQRVRGLCFCAMPSELLVESWEFWVLCNLETSAKSVVPRDPLLFWKFGLEHHHHNVATRWAFSSCSRLRPYGSMVWLAQRWVTTLLTKINFFEPAQRTICYFGWLHARKKIQIRYWMLNIIPLIQISCFGFLRKSHAGDKGFEGFSPSASNGTESSTNFLNGAAIAR